MEGRRSLGCHDRLTVTVMAEETKEKPAQGNRRVVVKRRLGDAQLMAGGSGVFLGDMTRARGLEVVELDDRDPKGVFEGR